MGRIFLTFILVGVIISLFSYTSYAESSGKETSTIPTNYDRIEKKPNFDNDSWIINKAISCYKNDEGVYSNIYMTVFNLSPKLP